MATVNQPRYGDQTLMTAALSESLPEKGPPPPTERQDMLSRRLRWYAATQYDHRSINFDGTKRVGANLREQIAAQGMIFGGMTADVGMDSLPWRYRHPAAPYHLARTITRRFTGLLFGADKHPAIECADDQQTAEFVQGLAEASRLWPRMTMARQLGGAMGSVAAIFRFSEGKPAVSVLDPRWCTPTYRDRTTKELSALEYRYYFPKAGADGKTTWWWYRRVITEQTDVVFHEVPCAARNPMWYVREQRDHHLGFFPGVWIQNSYVEEEDDGEPDCCGIYDTLEEMDELFSAAGVGTKANCDPTVVVATDETFASLQKGSKHAIKVSKGGSAAYMEMTGTGTKAALELALQHRSNALEVAQCVVDEPDQNEQTATATERRYQAMWDRAAEFREQYGEMGVKPFVEKMVKAARVLGSGKLSAPDGRSLVMQVTVPPIVKADPVTGVATVVTRVPGAGSAFSLAWPSFTRPGPAQAQQAAAAVVSARSTNPPVIDIATATSYLAQYFGGGDPEEIKARALAEHQAAQDADSQAFIDGMQPPGASAVQAPGAGGELEGASMLLGGAPKKTSDAALSGPQVAQLLAVISAVTNGSLTPEAAVEILVVAFPFTRDAVEAMVGKAVRPAPAAAPAPAPAPPQPPPGG